MTAHGFSNGRKLAACVARLGGGHLLAALTCGATLALTSATRTVVTTAFENPREWTRVLLSMVPEWAGGVLLMALVVSVVAAVVTLPATVLLSPLAIHVARRAKSSHSTLIVGGLVGLLLGLPISIVIMGLADWTELRPTQIIGIYISALPDFGLASVASGVAFAAVIKGRERR